MALSSGTRLGPYDAFRMAFELRPQAISTSSSLGLVYPALAELIAGHPVECAYQIAQAAAFRGEADLAFTWLERAYSMHDTGMTEIKADPLLVNLHADPRWLSFLARMGF